MPYLRLQAAPALSKSPPRVDYKAGVIRGVSIMQAVEALGHGAVCDQTTLSQVAAAVNSNPSGIKSRFTHPGACDDGMGKMLGRVKNASVVGDKVIGDLHMSQTAKTSPSGDLYSYVMDLAANDPGSFGLSVVIVPDLKWKLSNGTEVAAEDDKRPAGAVGKLPVIRVRQLKAVDAVDEPAANRSGLFADAAELSAATAFPMIDTFLADNGLSLERARTFMDRYFNARAPKPKPAPTPAPVSSGDLIEESRALLASLGRSPAPVEPVESAAMKSLRISLQSLKT